jgi:hypothetical protein
METYILGGIVLIAPMFVCAVIALLRAERKDIPAVVEALARWWGRK